MCGGGQGGAGQGLVRFGGWGAGPWVILAPNEESAQELWPPKMQTLGRWSPRDPKGQLGCVGSLRVSQMQPGDPPSGV